MESTSGTWTDFGLTFFITIDDVSEPYAIQLAINNNDLSFGASTPTNWWEFETSGKELPWMIATIQDLE